MQANIIRSTSNIAKLVLIGLLGFGFAAPTTLLASDYDTGIFEFQQKLAKGGNPQAQYQLATMYESGRGVAKDTNKAHEWYKKSAANNYKPAKHRLIYLEVKTSGFKDSHKAWINQLVADAKKGDGEAMFILGNLYEKGTGVKTSLKRAQGYYKSSATIGNVDAENRLYDVEQKINQQRQQSSKAAKQDNQKQKQAEQKNKEAAARAKQDNVQKQQADAARKQKAARDKARAEETRKARYKAEQERKKLEAERLKLAEERRKLAAQKQALAKEKAAKQKAAAAQKAEAEPEHFESELCTGKAARFRTQCK